MNRAVNGVLALVVLGGLVMACDDDRDDGVATTTVAGAAAPSSTTASAGVAAPVTIDEDATTTTSPRADDPAAPDAPGAEQHGVVTTESVAAALGKIDGFVQAEMDEFGVPGVAVAVVHDDEVVFSKGYGVREIGKPDTIDPDTVFQIASLSKPVTATAIAGLVGKQVIEWDDPVEQYSPDLTFSDPWVTDHVTFADLYSHRSGLPGGFGNQLETMGYSRDEILSRLKFIPLNPFRASYSYSNFGMTAAGDAAAKAAGTSFEDMVQEQLFGPAGMTESSASYTDFLARDNRATIHALIHGQWVLGPPRQPDAQAPAGGVSSSVKDLARWARLVLAGGTLDGKPVIDEAALGETHVPHILRSPPAGYDAQSQFYGLGWNVENDHLGFLRWAHSGAFTNGTGTTVVLLPTEQLGVIVLTNGMPLGIPEIIADEIIDQIATGGLTTDWRDRWNAQIFAHLFDPPPGLDPPANPTSAQPNDAYIGTYRNDVYGDIAVIAQGDGLALVEGPAHKTYPMTHLDADTFTVVRYPELPDAKEPVVFTIGADGKASSMEIGDGEGPGTGVLQRVP